MSDQGGESPKLEAPQPSFQWVRLAAGPPPDAAHLLTPAADGMAHRLPTREVENNFVTRAGGISRSRLWHSLRSHHAAFVRCEVLPRQWIGGEFVSPAPEPASLVAVSLLSPADLPRLDALPRDKAALLHTTADDDDGLAVGIVVELPDDHPNAAAMARVRAYWHRRLGCEGQPRRAVLEIQLGMSDGDTALQ